MASISDWMKGFYNREVLVLLDAASQTVDGPVKMLGSPVGVPRAALGLQVIHTGTPDEVVVTLYGSLDGANFFELDDWDSTSESNGDIVFIENKPVVYVRAKLEKLEGGDNPTVTALLAQA